MKTLAAAAVAFVALEHLWIFFLEAVLWTKPTGRKVFGTTEEFARASKALAANQGLYNGFLAAGLIWGLLADENAFAIRVFFLSWVIVAGIFGAATAKRSILWVQGLPAAVALALVFAAR